MRTFRDAKAMARALRAEVLARHQVDLSHSTALEIVARQFGFDNWNVLSAKIQSETGARDVRQEISGPRLRPAIPILRIFSKEKATDSTSTFSAARSTGSTDSTRTLRSTCRSPGRS